MADDIDIEYSLDPSGYLVGVNQIDAANQRVQSSMGSIVTTSTALQKAYEQVTPKRATIAGLGLLAQQSAQTQQNLSGLAATSKTTGQNVDVLAGGIRSLAREMPLGAQGSRQLYEQVTKLGVSTGAEKQIAAIARSAGLLSGATGEGPAQLASGLTDLARASGNNNLDPKRYADLGDSLTTISAKSGASATGVLAFSKSIAPMAQSAGIGATGVLGISSAFVRLGEDGLAGGTAVNKMLSDMNRAVREGSPEMKTYAAMVGKTTSEFEALFKNNPAEALTQVTEAVAKAGPGGVRMLEQIGVEGVRGQRSLQALSASGGLRPAIATATEAYGSGSTEEAAKAAYGGLNDSLTQLKSTTGELTDAMGAPLLSPLTAFSNALQKPIGMLASLAGSRGAQTAGSVAAWGGVAAMGLGALARPIGAYMLGRQALTSLPLRGLLGGFAGGYGMQEGRTTRFGAPMEGAINAGAVPRTLGGRLGERAYWLGTGFGERYRELNPPGGRSILGGIAGGVRNYGQNFAQTYMGMLEQQARNARDTSGLNRTDAIGASRAFRGAWVDARAAGSGMNPLSGLVAGTRAFNEHVMTTGRATATFRESLRTAGAAFVQTSRFAVQAGASDIGRAGRSIGRAIGPEMGIGLGIAGVSALVGYGISNQRRQAEESKAYFDKDIAATINRYRESAGLATPTSTTFGSQSEQNVAQLSRNAQSRGFAGTRTITDEDWNVSQGSKASPTHTYSGSAAQMAAQIRTMAPGGMSAAELQAVKVDLGRQMERDQAQRVLNLLPDSFAAGENTKPQDVNSLVKDVIAGLASAPTSGSGATMQTLLGQRGAFSGALQGGGNLAVTEGGNPLLPKFLQTNAGGGLYRSALTDETKAGVQSLSEGINQQYQTSSTKFQGTYARQQRIQAYNAALQAAVDAKNGDLFAEISNRAGKELGGAEFAGAQWSASKFTAAGGDFAKVLSGYDKEFASTLSADQKAGLNTKTGGINPVLQAQTYTRGVRDQSALLGDIFDATGTSKASRAMSASIATPADVQLQSAAMQETIDAAKKAGMSLSDLAVEAAKAATAVPETGDAWRRLQSLQARAQQESRVEQRGMTGTQRQMARYGQLQRLVEIKPTTDTEKAAQEGYRNEMLDMQDAMEQRMKARIQVQRQSDIAVSRATRDHEQSQKYAQADYLKSVFRAETAHQVQVERQTYAFNLSQERAEKDFAKARTRTKRDFAIAEERQEYQYNLGRERQMRDFGISLERQEKDYQIQLSRQRRDFAKSEKRQAEDYNLGRERQVRDFNISLQRGEADYMKSRERQIRDFNTSLKRQVEDMAKGLMDPYKRIQTQATWDARNLLVNLGQQNTAMTKQLDQLAALREAGLSQQSIDQLGLGKVDNAQQVNNLATDTLANPDLIRQLNEAAAAREAIAAQFQSDPSNKEAARAKEDFDKSLRDTEEDYRKSVERGREDLARSLADSALDFAKALARSREDFATNLRDQEEDMRKSLARAREDLRKAMADQAKDFATARANNRADLNKSLKDQEVDFRESIKRSNADFATSLANAQKDLDTSLSYMEKDLAESMSRQDKSFKVQMSDMQEDIVEADKEIGGSFEELAKNYNKAIHGHAINWQKTLRNDTNAWVTDIQRNVAPKISAIFGSFGVQMVASTYGGTSKPGTGKSGLADGGPVPGFSPHSKADNVPIWATAGEFMQPVETVQHYGTSAMEAIRQKKIPKELIAGYADGGLIEFGKKLQNMGYQVAEHPLFGGVNPVHSTNSQHYNKFGPGGGGAIDVNHDQSNEVAAINKIIGLAGQFGLRSIWQVNDHYDHAHFDISKGADMLGASVKDLAAAVRGSGSDATTIDELFAGMPGGGWAYSGLTKALKKAMTAKYGDDLLGVLAGDTGAHGSSAAANQAIARSLLGSYGFGPEQMTSLTKLWNGESGWNQFADNPTSDAYGIPQSLPGRKMASAGADWLTNPATQIKWGLGYIKDRYGSPDKAWKFWNQQSPHWYDAGGYLQPGMTSTANGTGAPEPVLTAGQWDDMSTLAELATAVLTQEQGRSLASANGVQMTVTNHNTITYDNRNNFGGAHFTIESNDPNDMARKLEQRATASRLTATKGVRWSSE